MEEHKKRRGVQTLLDLAQVVTDALVEAGVEAERSREIGLLAAERLRATYGGDQMYIPSGLALALARRDLQMYAEFDGTNQGPLAKKYDLTVRQVYNVIERVRAEERARQQLGLPFDPPDDDTPEAA